MSWKSFVSAGLLCVLASPAFAQPVLQVVNGPALNAQGNWVWTVSINPSTDDTPVAVELGFDANRNIVGTPTRGALFDGLPGIGNVDNPGADIFGTNVSGDWEVHTAGFPVGLQVGTAANADKIFSAIGSEANLSNGAVFDTYLTIVTTGPAAGAETGNIQVLGAYGAGGDEGRIAQATGATTSSNYRAYVGTATRTLEPGDINLSGITDGVDVGILGGCYDNPIPACMVGGWTIGDFDRDGDVDGVDVGILGGGYDTPSNASISNLSVTGILDPPAGGGAGLSSAVPEPASFALVGLALLGGLGLLRGRR